MRAASRALMGVGRPDPATTAAPQQTGAMGGQENVGFEAEAKIRRSDFGLGFGVPMVGDEVKLKIHAAFQKQ